MFQTFKARFILPVMLSVIALVAIGSFALSEYLTKREKIVVEANINHEIATLTQSMDVTAALMDDRAISGLSVLRSKVVAGGSIVRGGTVDIAGVNVNDVLIGGRSQAGAHALIDDVTTMIGGSASIYTKQGDDFVRLSTNVKKQGGVPGFGTRMERGGKVYTALAAGKPFYGITEILGRQYFAAYEPLLDDNGSMIGAIYFGYLADFSVIQSAVDRARILDSGYLALLDADGVVRYRKSSVTNQDTDRMVKNQVEGWEVNRYVIPVWNYTVVAGYPRSELNAPVSKVTRLVLASGALLAVVISAVIYFLLDINVISLLGGEPAKAADNMRRIAGGDLSVEIAVKENDDTSMMASMRVMQMKLKNITRSIQGPMTEALESICRLEQGVAHLTGRIPVGQIAELDTVAEQTEEAVKATNILQKAINRLRV